jgi:hypothetical protein
MKLIPLAFICGVAFFAFFLLLWIQTSLSSEPKVMNLFHVMIPLFLLEGIVLLSSVGMFFMLGNYHSKKQKALPIFWCCGWWIALPLLLTFQTLLAEKLEGNYGGSFMTIFSPLIATEVFSIFWVAVIQFASVTALSDSL